ncbi:MAG: glucosaminidase domain-containing protein [Bacteroidota bacterium]
MKTLLRYIVLAVLSTAALIAPAQPPEYKMTRAEYIDKFKDDAIKEMLMHGVPASITLSQAMLESANGNSDLAMYANNHFGIKCHVGWEGMTYYKDDDEKNECFRKYNTVLESYSDHSMFLKTRDRYKFLFDLKVTDYKGWAHGLKSAGYATDPNYAYKLIQIIEQYKLHEYDKLTTVPVTKEEEKEPITKTPVVTPAPKHKSILKVNNRKYIIAQQGDSYQSIAQEFETGLHLIYKYNDLGKSASLKPGDIIFIEPKRKKGDAAFHTVKKGETLYGISQQYGVKLKSIYKINKLKPGYQPKEGDKIYLKKKKA